MPTGFRAKEGKKRIKVNQDLNGVSRADVGKIDFEDWRVVSGQFSLSSAARILKTDPRRLKKAAKELKLKTYWHKDRHIILARQMERLRRFFK